MRKVKDAKDLSSNELIYFKGHAKATYMSDGRTVEDAINDIPSSGGGGGGETGPQGPQGEQGPKGEDGVGIASVVQTTTSSADGGSNVVTVTLSDGKTSTFTIKNGSKGSQGPKGDQGEQGPKGDQGEQGPKGDKGDKGDTGATGANGTNGKDGADGATFTPSVDATGNLSWTNNKGLTNPPTVNIKGPKGDSGEGGGNSTYITDFNLQDLNDVYEGEVRQIRHEDLANAILEKKRILVPSYENGFCLLAGEAYENGLEIYCAIYTSEGSFYNLEIYNGILDSEHTWRDDFTQAKVMPVTCGEINSLAEANGFMSQEGMCYALPDAATGDEDDVLVSERNLKTINGQSLVGSGDIAISGGSSEGGGMRVVNMGEDSFEVIEAEPNTIYVFPVNGIGGGLEVYDFIPPTDAYAEYTFIFQMGAMNSGFMLPDYVTWANGQYPEVISSGSTTYGNMYELSISASLVSGGQYIYKAVLTHFKEAQL